MTNKQTIVHKTQHRKIKTEKQKHNLKLGWGDSHVFWKVKQILLCVCHPQCFFLQKYKSCYKDIGGTKDTKGTVKLRNLKQLTTPWLKMKKEKQHTRHNIEN